MDHKVRTVEGKLAQLAEAAHGVVTHREMLAAGVSADEIRWRLRIGALLREFRGVYRVGHRAPSLEARYMAAVKACGSSALLSGRAAAYLLGLIRGAPPPPEVTAPTERRVPGVITHRARGAPAEATTWRGIPITTVARTLVDLAAVLDLDALTRACHEAGVRFGTTPSHVDAVLARRPRVKGVEKLRRILHGAVHVTLSALETRFLQRLREADLPLPETNRPAGGRRVDCRWSHPPLTVELDSYRFHHSRHAWEQDRRREREAYARGDQFRRFTYGDVYEHPRPMLRELAELLRRQPS